MKKKLFTALALFASLAITACGGGGGSKRSSVHRHTYGDWGVDPEHAPTCTAAGKEIRTCSACGYVDSRDAAALGHEGEPDADATTGWTPGTNPTCTAPGTHSYTCTRCNQPVEVAIPATGHDPEPAADSAAWIPGTNPTCTEAGSHSYVCSKCNQPVQVTIPATGHAYGEWTPKGDATCGQRAEEERECANCHNKETRSGTIIQHNWQVTGTVDAGDGGIAYDLVKCSKCNKDGLMVKTKKADGTDNMTISAGTKTAPTGCVKLGNSNDTMVAVIKLAEAKTGKIYIRGSMDYWYTSSNQNEQKGIYNGKSGGGADKANNKANFTMEVGTDASNLTEVELNAANKDLLYKDWFPAEVGFENVSDTNWSTIGDIEVGNVSLAAGLNTMKFTRTDSYNIAVYAFVVVFDTVA